MPNVYILHGEEELLRSEALSDIRRQVAVAGMGDINVTTLDGRRLAVRELRDACNTMPFLTPQRLVIVHDLLGQFSATSEKKSAVRENTDAAEIIDYLPRVPPTTVLVFNEAGLLAKSNPVLKAASRLNQACDVRQFGHLDSRRGELGQWIVERAAKSGARIDSSAAALLAASAGGDLRRVDQELEKLAAYAGYTGTINRQMVEDLVPPVFEDRIFSLVDALGGKRGRVAVRMLEEFLDNRVNELYLLAMIARQFRLIIGVQDLATEGLAPAEIGRRLSIGSRDDFVVRKLVSQAGMFEPEELIHVQELILATDQAIKTGKMDPTLALQTLTIAICAQRKKSSSRTR